MHSVKLFDHLFGSSTSIKNATIAVPSTSRSIEIFTTTDQILPDLFNNSNYNDSGLEDHKNVSLNCCDLRLCPLQPNFPGRLNMRLPFLKTSGDSGVEVDNDGGKTLPMSNTCSNHYNFIAAKQKISDKASSSSYSCKFSRNLSTEESCRTSNSTRASYYSFLFDSGKNSIRKTFSNYVSAIQEEKAMASVPLAPIDVEKAFIPYAQERRKKKILFKGELLMIRKAFDNCHKCDYASSKGLEQKNNYIDVLPFDDNRVTLEELPSCSHSTYINASYVDSFYKQRAYIVTQAVKSKATCIDFWRMVWESQSNCVVMLTKVFDFMKVMCLQYWPLTKTLFGDIVVELLETKNYANFVIRTMRIAKKYHFFNKIHDNKLTSPWRLIKQFHFTEWEANGLPYISALLDFRRRVRLHVASSEKNEVAANNNNGLLDDGPTTTTTRPIIVHCSNGGERSGAFLAIDANLELAKEENIVDVFGYGKIMINARSHLINSLDLYMFIYDVLLEAVQCKIEPFPMHELKSFSTLYLTKKSRQIMEMKHSEQYKLLCHLTPQLTIGDCAGGHRLENRGKNRDVMVVPPDYARPYLSTLHGESKDYTYINAVNVDGFTRKNEWIVTEWPKHNTVDSLWALIFDHSCHTLVNLTTAPKNKKAYPPFIHNKNRHTYGPFNVEVISYQSYPCMTSHIVKVWKKSASNHAQEMEAKRSKSTIRKTYANFLTKVWNDGESESLVAKGLGGAMTFSLSDAQVPSKANQCDFDFKVCNVISAKMWPVHNKVPQSTSGFIDVIKMVRSWRKRAPDKPESKPTVVLSHTGVTRCGIFVAANIVIDQMDMDQECDLFHACKLIKLNRPQLIDNKEEYKYLYDLVLHYYIMNADYQKVVLGKNGPISLSQDATATAMNHTTVSAP